MPRTYHRWGAASVLIGLTIVLLQAGDGNLYAQGQGAGQVPNPLPPPTPMPPQAPMTAPAMPGYKMAPPAATPGVVVPNGYPGANSTTPQVQMGFTDVQGPRAFTAPNVLEGERALPINLATALRLANAEAWDIGIAAQQVRVAAAQLTQADVLWLPTLASGVDYQHHGGVFQNPSTGAVEPMLNRNSIEFGGAPELTFAFTEAIFEPLAQRQTTAARKADLQTATNDTTYSVARAYFDVQQARGVLAGTQDTIRRMKLVLERIEKMAPEIVPMVEVPRARAVLESLIQQEVGLRETWNVSSAELARIIRIDPAAQVIPLEPPHIKVTLVSPDQPLDALLPVALNARPELKSYRALTEAALRRWREEQFRPLLPSVYLRGGTNELPDSMMFGAMSGGPNGTFGKYYGRADYEVEVMWELRNLGIGNLAAMRQRRAEYDVTRMQAYRLQDFVAREVAQAYAIVRSARERAIRAEEELKQAEISATQNYEGLGQVIRLGTVLIPIIRPQEADVAMTALLQAYEHYYGTIADYNRAQFQLYRALGNPAQLIPDLEQNPEGGRSNPNPAPPPPAKSLPPSTPNGVSVDPNCTVAASAPAGATTPAASAATSATPATSTQKAAPPAATGVVQTSGTAEASPASLLVRLPETAELLCDGVKMKMTGRERNFVTPPLPPGRTYPYEIRIRWAGPDGKIMEITRQVQVTAGQKTVVDFFGK